MNSIIKKRLRRSGVSLWSLIKGKISFIFQVLVWALVFFFLIPILGNVYLIIFPQNKNLGLNDFILLLTAALLFVYTYETQQTKKELASQNEIEQMPIMVLYSRKFTFTSVVSHKYEMEGYRIECEKDGPRSNYAFTLKNIGKGPAFNVRIWAEDFFGEKYEEKFILPTEECAVKILKYKGKRSEELTKPESLNDFKDKIISVCCESLSGKEYFFDYKIISIEEGKIEFIKKEKL
jgi:hypothetical protein